MGKREPRIVLGEQCVDVSTRTYPRWITDLEIEAALGEYCTEVEVPVEEGLLLCNANDCLYPGVGFSHTVHGESCGELDVRLLGIVELKPIHAAAHHNLISVLAALTGAAEDSGQSVEPFVEVRGVVCIGERPEPHCTPGVHRKAEATVGAVLVVEEIVLDLLARDHRRRGVVCAAEVVDVALRLFLGDAQTLEGELPQHFNALGQLNEELLLSLVRDDGGILAP